MKLDDDILELGRLDAVRVSPAVTRAFEAGPDGLEVLAFGPHHEGDGELIPGGGAPCGGLRSLAVRDGLAILVLQHIACEPPGAYEDVMLERGARLHRVELDEGEPLPDWREFDGMVVMGGPMGACDDADHPWLVAERECIGEAVRDGLPFFGACLGSQLLAASLGARVYTGETPEVGVLDVELTEAGRNDPVLGGLPASFPTLQWHSDSFDLPDGAVGLATSPAYANQAFRVGTTAYAVQFHVEVTSEMAAEWATVPDYARALERVRGPGALDELLAAFEARREEMTGHARTLFARWFELVLERQPATAQG